jgi:hypothetical protein
MVCGVVGTCLILVRVVPGFCTYQWEVQKCTIEMYKSGARAVRDLTSAWIRLDMKTTPV